MLQVGFVPSFTLGFLVHFFLSSFQSGIIIILSRLLSRGGMRVCHILQGLIFWSISKGTFLICTGEINVSLCNDQC